MNKTKKLLWVFLASYFCGSCATSGAMQPEPDKAVLIEMTAFLKEATAACGKTPHIFLFKDRHPGKLLITNGVIQFLSRQFGFYAKCEPDVETPIAEKIDPKTSAGL